MLTVIDGLVLAVLVLSVASLEVTVALPAVLRVILKVLVPEVSAEFAGKVALLSEEVMPTVSLTVVTTFQFASTALTVTLKAVPAVSAVGVPVLPLEVPGAAVSPGTSNCNFANEATFTVIDELVFGVLAPSVLSVAVVVRLPADLRVTLKVFVPATRAALAGRTALLSEEVMPMVSVAFVIRFQFASTAFTVTLKALPAVWAEAEPVLPLGVPGAAVSPGARICNLVKAPTTTGIEALVLAVIPACVASEAVTVALPAVLRVTLKV